MLSKVDICNKALTLVGASPITSLSDDTRQARILNRVYEGALRAILSEGDWKFARKRKLLALSADTVDWYHTDEGETYVYVRPSDCIRIFKTNDKYAIWREEGDYIISNTSGLGIRYVYYLDSPSKYYASFTEAFVDKLASDISFAILNSTTKGESMLKKYEGISLPKALADNSQGETPELPMDSAWELSKYNDFNLDA